MGVPSPERRVGRRRHLGLPPLSLSHWRESGTLPLMAEPSVRQPMARTSFLTLDQKGRTTVPEEIRAALGVEPGDFILLERTERGTFELVPATLVPNDQLWFHHPEMQARVARAESDFAAGRSTRTQTPEEAQAFLDSLKQSSNR